MRNTIFVVLMALVVAFFCCVSVLDKRMRRKASQGGISIFSFHYPFRALATREALISILLTAVMAGIIVGFSALDRAGYFGP
jgi:hypothetical protein